jgi:hypothetical protein
VADAASDQVLVFNAKQLSVSPLRSFGGGGELPGQLSQPRGLALWHAGDLGPGALAVEAGVDGLEEGSLEKPTGAARAQPLLLVAEYHNNRVSVFGSLDGTLRRTLGDVETVGGALPLRHPFDVVHAHGLLIVSEYEDKRLVCFRADAECMPLQILTPPHCGRLGGLTTDGDWIIAVDASRSKLHYFFVAAPPGSADEQGGPDAAVRGGGHASDQLQRRGESGHGDAIGTGNIVATPPSPSSPATSLRQRLLEDLKRMKGDADTPAGSSSSSSSSVAGGSGSCEPPAETAVHRATSAVAAAMAAREEAARRFSGVATSSVGAGASWVNADPQARMLRPTLAVVRERFRAGHVVSAAELDAMSEEQAHDALVDKAEVSLLRERRNADGDGSLTKEEMQRIEAADTEKARIAVLAQKLAASLASIDTSRSSGFDPFGRYSGRR